MNYLGRIVRDDLLSGTEAGQMIKASLSRMYGEGRFLGGFEYSENDLAYSDSNEGDVEFFRVRESIRRGNETAYELDYHGGLIRE